MTKLGCLRTNALMGRRSEGLSAAEALRLEEHLSGCTECSREAALLDGMRQLAETVPANLPQVAREQAIRRAIAQAEALPDAGAGLRRLWPAAAFATAALAAAAATFALLPREWMTPTDQVASSKPPVQHATPQAPARGDRVLSGAVQVGSAQLGGGGAIGSETELRASAPATVALAQAQVELRAGTVLHWDGATRNVRLDAGSIVADVDPRAGKSFTVQTARFTVLVLGTRFEVTPEAVYVARGHVRVLAPDGTVLAQSLAADERLVVPSDLGTPAAKPAALAPSSRESSERRERPAAARASATALLQKAREQLADQRVSEARHSLDAALDVARDAGQRAEAMSLRAECALVAGDLGAAVEAYLRVAHAYASAPAGQNALFAAARLEAERGRSAAGAALLERYLARYPNGRFVKEARTRLRELGAVLDHEP